VGGGGGGARRIDGISLPPPVLLPIVPCPPLPPSTRLHPVVVGESCAPRSVPLVPCLLQIPRLRRQRPHPLVEKPLRDDAASYAPSHPVVVVVVVSVRHAVAVAAAAATAVVPFSENAAVDRDKASILVERGGAAFAPRLPPARLLLLLREGPRRDGGAPHVGRAHADDGGVLCRHLHGTADAARVGGVAARGRRVGRRPRSAGGCSPLVDLDVVPKLHHVGTVGWAVPRGASPADVDEAFFWVAGWRRGGRRGGRRRGRSRPRRRRDVVRPRLRPLLHLDGGFRSRLVPRGLQGPQPSLELGKAGLGRRGAGLGGGQGLVGGRGLAAREAAGGDAVLIVPGHLSVHSHHPLGADDLKRGDRRECDEDAS